MSEPMFYRAFEDRHRGSRATIEARLAAYVPFLRALREQEDAPALVDLGCGRGEWLALARAEGWRVQGVDLDAAMLADCRAAGLDVQQRDALEHLRGMSDASVAVVSGFHVAEHLPFDTLRALIGEALRVLRPGGLLILETPNPENLVVGSSAFHMDPTHVRPLPPALLSFLAEFAGFARVATLRLHEGLAADAPVALIDVLAGVSPDYAIVASKAGDLSPALQELLGQKHGFTLNQLAERYDRRMEARIDELRLTAQLAREAAIQFGASRRELALRMQALERTFASAPAVERTAAERMFRLQDRVHAMEASLSWRITAPLRWAGAKRIAAAVAVHGALQRHPLVHRTVRKLARVLRLVPRSPAPPAGAPASSAPMTAAARRVEQQLTRTKRKDG